MENRNTLCIWSKISDKTSYFYKKKLGNNCCLHSIYHCNLSISIKYLYFFNKYNLDLHNFHIFFHFYIVIQYVYIASI